MQDNPKAKPHELKQTVRTNLEAVTEGRIPDESREAARETVAKAREGHEKFAAAARSGFKDMEDAMAASYDGVKAVSGKMFQHFASNTEAAFDAAQAMAGAKTIPEATQIYARFLQERFAAMGQQTQELFEASVSAANRASSVTAGAANRTAERARKTMN